MLTLRYLEKVARLNSQTGYVPRNYQSSFETGLKALQDASACAVHPKPNEDLIVRVGFEYNSAEEIIIINNYSII